MHQLNKVNITIEAITFNIRLKHGESSRFKNDGNGRLLSFLVPFILFLVGVPLGKMATKIWVPDLEPLFNSHSSLL